MTLADLENEVLSSLQQTALVNFGGIPNWAAQTNGEFDQPTVDHWLNRGYLKVMRDVSDIDVAMFSATFLTTAQTSRYPLPPPVSGQGPFDSAVQIAFDVDSVGPGNTDLAIVARYPLAVDTVITAVAVVFQSLDSGGIAPLVNVVLGEGGSGEPWTVPQDDAVATAGQALFAEDQAAGSVAGTPTVLVSPTSAVWPAGSELTLRVATGAASQVSGIKVVLAGLVGGTGGLTLNPPVAELRRLFYTPQGVSYTLEMAPKIRMMPWKEFQMYTAAGYFQPSAYGQQPEICSVTPDRRELAFYPGTANAGDTVELQWSCVPTPGTLVPLLVNETDVPFMPDDFQELIPTYALSKLWPKARAMQAAADALKLYDEQMAYRRAMWKRRHGGDQQRFTDVTLERAQSGPYGWW